MAIYVGDVAITSIETITAFDITTGNLMFVLDELQNATISQTEEKSDITGKGGRKITSLKRNKAVTVSGTNGLLSHGLLEAQTGSEFENKVVAVQWTDYLTVKSNAATATYKAVGTTGAEIEAVYVRGTDGKLGERLVQGESAGDGTFAYNPTSKAFTFTGLEDGTEVVAYYKRNIMADSLANASDSYSKKAELYIDMLGENKCGDICRVQIHIPKADFSGEFSIEAGGDQSVHAFEAEALAGSCGAGANLFTYAIFGANEEDVA
jgi:hypothetical protein